MTQYHALHQQHFSGLDFWETLISPRSRTLTASSLSLMLSRVSEMSAGMAVLQKEVILLKPPYVMMGMMPACSHAGPGQNERCMLADRCVELATVT